MLQIIKIFQAFLSQKLRDRMHVVSSETIEDFVAKEEIPVTVMESGSYTTAEGAKERLMRLLTKRQEIIAKVHR